MRIIAGSLKGRQFDSPHTQRTHPMGDKLRGALFNILGDVEGLTLLDPFGGSGAIAFEAVSRGVSSAIVLEQDKAAQQAIDQNTRNLGIGHQVRLVRASANAWLQTSPPTQTFDLIICDPPYHDLQLPLISRLSQRLAAGGLLVLSWPAQEPLPSFSGLELVQSRVHGDAQLVFYRR